MRFEDIALGAMSSFQKHNRAIDMASTGSAGTGMTSGSRPIPKDEKMVIFASSLGTVFEWYDFYLFGVMSAIIAANFFTALCFTKPTI